MADGCNAGVDAGFAALGYGQVAVLGVIQGLTELLPVSSTAHMRLVPALFGWPDPGSAFSALMQLAALGAVVSYFHRDLRSVANGFAAAALERRWREPGFRLGLAIVAATIPIAAAGAFLSPLLNACGSPLRALPVIGFASLAMALLLGAAELATNRRRALGGLRFGDAALVGLAQVGALIPGVSRSGSTLTAAMALGFNRPDAARLSFLIGIPAIAAAGLKEAAVLAKAGLPASAWIVLSAGLLVASCAAFLAIKLLMSVLERFSSWPFVAYRAGMGAVILFGLWAGWWA